ncbi:MAG: hypothetical protein WC667_04955 [Sulfurimonas sp.]
MSSRFAGKIWILRVFNKEVAVHIMVGLVDVPMEKLFAMMGAIALLALALFLLIH